MLPFKIILASNETDHITLNFKTKRNDQPQKVKQYFDLPYSQSVHEVINKLARTQNIIGEMVNFKRV